MAAGSVTLEVILRAVDQLTGPLRQSGTEFDKLAKKAEAAGARAQKMGQDMANVGKGMMVAGAAVGAGLGKAVSDFAEFQAGQAEAINAFSTKDGLSGSFDKITAQAIEMGNLFPATTGQMFELATAMKMAGASAENMANGGFKAAGSLQVLLKLNPKEAGQFFQEMSNAMGVAGQDAEKFADMIQRVKYSSGLSFEGMHEGMKFLGAPMKKLGIQGSRDMPLILAAMGALKKGGLDDSQVGTSMGQFFDKIAVAQAKIAGGDSRGAAMKYAFEGLDKAGVDLNFFDEKGNFSGAANAFAQIEQLKKASTMVQSIAGKALFGTQGQRIITSSGAEQINEMLKAMGQQESLLTRQDRILNTLSSRWIALTGTTTNAMVGIGKSMEPILNPLLETLNKVVTYTQGWIDRNPRLTRTITAAAAAFAVFMLGGGGALWATGKMISLAGTLAQTWASVGSKIMVAAPWMLVAALAGAAIAANWDDVEPSVKRAEKSFDSLGESMSRVFGGKDTEWSEGMKAFKSGAATAEAFGIALEFVAYGMKEIGGLLDIFSGTKKFVEDIVVNNSVGAFQAAKTGYGMGGLSTAMKMGSAYKNEADERSIMGYTSKTLGTISDLGTNVPILSRGDEHKADVGELLRRQVKGGLRKDRGADGSKREGDTTITINAGMGADPKAIAEALAPYLNRNKRTEERKAF